MFTKSLPIPASIDALVGSENVNMKVLWNIPMPTLQGMSSVNESLLGAHKVEVEIYEERAGWSFVTGKCARSVATPYLTVSPVRGSSTTVGSSCLAPYVDQTFTTVACGTPVASRSEAGCSCHERSDADY